MTKKYLQLTLKLFIILFLFCVPCFVFAVSTLDPTVQTSIDSNLTAVSPYADADGTSAATIVGAVVKVFLGLLGIIFLILIIYAGYNWMTAGGDEPKVKKATDTIKRAIIGLIIVVGAYAIYGLVSGFVPALTNGQQPKAPALEGGFSNPEDRTVGVVFKSVNNI